MRGDNHLLALTTTVDEVTGEIKPVFSFPVQICKATDDGKDVRFDIAGPSGAPRKQQFVDEATGELVADEDCLRGIRVGDEFKPIDPDAIAQIEEATKIKTMVALGTIPLAGVREKYGDRVKGVYFVQSPTKNGSAKAYRLTYEALRAVKKGKKVEREAQAIVTKRTARSRQTLGVIYADEQRGCLMMLAVEFAAKMREPDAQVLAPQTADVDEAQIEMARKVLATLGDGEQALAAEIDEAMPMRAELIEKALAGQTIEPPTKVAEVAQSDNLMAALEASLAS